jgi:hypothetical protein
MIIWNLERRACSLPIYSADNNNCFKQKSELQLHATSHSDGTNRSRLWISSTAATLVKLKWRAPDSREYYPHRLHNVVESYLPLSSQWLCHLEQWLQRHCLPNPAAIVHTQCGCWVQPYEEQWCHHQQPCSQSWLENYNRTHIRVRKWQMVKEKKRQHMKYPKEYMPKLTMYKLSIPWTSTEHCARIWSIRRGLAAGGMACKCALLMVWMCVEYIHMFSIHCIYWLFLSALHYLFAPSLSLLMLHSVSLGANIRIWFHMNSSILVVQTFDLSSSS